MNILLNAENIRVKAGATLLVHPVSLMLQAGRPFTILGETGSGKSLLAQAIIGTLPHTLLAGGRVTIGDRRLDLSRPSCASRTVGAGDRHPAAGTLAVAGPADAGRCPNRRGTGSGARAELARGPTYHR